MEMLQAQKNRDRLLKEIHKLQGEMDALVYLFNDTAISFVDLRVVSLYKNFGLTLRDLAGDVLTSDAFREFIQRLTEIRLNKRELLRMELKSLEDLFPELVPGGGHPGADAVTNIY